MREARQLSNPAGRLPHGGPANRMRSTLLATSAIALLCPGLLFAQDAADKIGADATIVVTGSHIRSSNFSSSSPLEVLGAEDMAKGGDTNVAQFLDRVPSIVGSDTPSSNNVNTATSSGLNTVALRNLGSTRTLVLVDGMRYVSGVSAGAGYGVDLNSIPAAAIKRIEVLTGGQSAAYGSDAVAGVINIITRTDFDGIEFNSQYGQTSRDDRRTKDISLTAGSNFADHKGNAWVSIGYSGASQIMASERDFSKVQWDAVAGPGSSQLNTLAFVGSSYIPDARVGNFRGDGSKYVTGSTPGTSDALNFNDYRQYMSPIDRLTVASRTRYEITDRLVFDLEANYARVDTEGRFEPIPFSVTADVFKSNLGGKSNFNLNPALGPVSPLLAGTALQTDLLGAGYNSLDQVSFVGRRLVEFGTRGEDNTRQTMRTAGSLDYSLTDSLDLLVSGTYGRTTQNQTVLGDINLERARYALDVVPNGHGGYQCADPVARSEGCVPFNPFAPPNDPLGIGISPAAVKYLSINTGNVGIVEQSVITAVLSGDVPVDLFGAGKPGFAIGAEYHTESGSDTPDSFRQDGIARGLTLRPTNGSYDVTDIFAEVKLPVDQRLNLDASVRSGDYSTVGRTTTGKLGFDAPVLDFLRFRGAASRAVRAPNIADLYAGGSTTSAFVFDPCNGINATTPGTVATNCRSIPAIANRIATTGSFTLTQPETQNTLGYIAGSSDVKQETAYTYTAGTVLTMAAPGGKLSAAFDYYDITIDNAITNPDRTQLLNRCFGAAPSSFNPTCGGVVVRSPTTGAALEVDSIATNQDQLKTNGLDIDINYAFTVDEVPGQFNIDVAGNYLANYSIKDYGTGDVSRLDGEVLYPHIRFNADLDYRIEDVDLDWRVTYWGATVDNNANIKLAPQFNNFGAQIYHDLYARYHWGKSIEFQFGVRNIFDVQPPLMTNENKYLQPGTNSNGTAFDLLGRRWYTGMTAKF